MKCPKCDTDMIRDLCPSCATEALRTITRGMHDAARQIGRALQPLIDATADVARRLVTESAERYEESVTTPRD